MIKRLVLHYAPEGTCELAWLAVHGSSRHHCDRHATCEVVVDENKYLACDTCWLEIAKLIGVAA